MGKRYSEEIKREALRYFRQGFGYSATARILGLPQSSVRVWHDLLRAGNLEWVANSYIRTDPFLLEEAVQEYISTGNGFHMLTQHYGISGSTILRGYRNYLNYGTVTLPRGRGAMKKLLKIKQELAEQIARLDAGIPPTKRELKDMKDMGIVYSCLIDVLLEDENLTEAKKNCFSSRKSSWKRDWSP